VEILHYGVAKWRGADPW